RQAIRIIETNPLVIGKESGGSKGGKEELYELRRSLAAKEETLNELSAVSQGRERQLSAANRSVQMLKMAIRERDERMNRNISEMQALEEKLTDFARTLRNKKEAVVEKRDKVKLHLVLANEKVRSLQQERKRIADHKGKLVDTDAWVGGVMQRAHTKDLKAFLKQAQGEAEEKAQAVRAELAVMRDEIFDLDDRANAAKRDSDKIGVACRSFLRTFKKISAVSVVDVLKNLTGQREGAEKSEGKKQVEAKLQGLMDDAMASSSGGGAGSGAGVDQVEVVRLKDFDLRTKDERKFVGMDLILNPEAYMHISMVEAEQMRFDEDYQCDLAKTDLDRIKNLPPQINLALPFLHTPSEVVAHRLFNKFCRCLTDSDFASKDYCYEGGSMEGDDDSEAPPRPGTGGGKLPPSAGAGAAGAAAAAA
ncbi:hypothetical protein EBZ37_13025, partial [bacterium]|nr:hypothetical protein [bacterium]